MTDTAITRSTARTVSLAAKAAAAVLVMGILGMAMMPGFNSTVPDVDLPDHGKNSDDTPYELPKPDPEAIGWFLTAWDPPDKEPDGPAVSSDDTGVITGSTPPVVNAELRYLGCIESRTSQGVVYHALLSRNGNQRLVGVGDTFADVEIGEITPTHVIGADRAGEEIRLDLKKPAGTLVGFRDSSPSIPSRVVDPAAAGELIGRPQQRDYLGDTGNAVDHGYGEPGEDGLIYNDPVNRPRTQRRPLNRDSDR